MTDFGPEHTRGPEFAKIANVAFSSGSVGVRSRSQTFAKRSPDVRLVIYLLQRPKNKIYQQKTDPTTKSHSPDLATGSNI